MSRLFQPWQLLVTILAGWMTEQQRQLIEYLRTENRVLKELHGKKRLLLTDDQRRRLAVPCAGPPIFVPSAFGRNPSQTGSLS